MSQDVCAPCAPYSPVVGLVGGIGSGKSALARWVAQHARIEILDADQLGHQALDDPTLAKLVLDRFPQAAAFIDNYFTRYYGVAEYLDRVLEECRRSGYAETIRGRRRPIHGIRPLPNRQRNMPERTAINSVIQGSAADLIKLAMIRVDQALTRDSHPGIMLLQIHDELVFEVPENELESLVALVRMEMESALDLDVPLLVDCAAGPNWLEIEEIPAD